jgi:hypothetical protein
VAEKPETKIVKKIIAHIKAKGGWARKVHGNAFSSGEPDIDAVLNGRSVKIEVKVPGKYPTTQQLARLRTWETAGSLAGWVTSVEEVDRLLGNVEDLSWVNPQLEIHLDDLQWD